MPLGEKEFRKALTRSQKAVEHIADWLTRMGYRVAVPDLRIRPHRSQATEYADNGDLFVEGHRVEVKWLSVDFPPWPYPTFIVDSAYHIERADPQPYAWVIVSRSLENIGVVYGADRDTWQVRERYDHIRQHAERFYEAEPQSVQWFTLAAMTRRPMIPKGAITRPSSLPHPSSSPAPGTPRRTGSPSSGDLAHPTPGPRVR